MSPSFLLATVVLAMSLFMPAHADLGMWMNYSTGKFEQVEKTLTPLVADESEQTANNLAPLCIARFKLKQYSALFKCLEHLERKISQGDTAISGFMIPESDIKPVPGWLRAGIYLDLGNYEKAIDSGKQALALINNDNGTWGPFPPKGYQIEILPTIAVAAALKGDIQTAKSYQSVLNGMDVSDTQAQKYENLKNVGLAQISMVLGEYDQVLRYLDDELHVWVRGLADMVSGGGSTGTIYDLPKWLMLGKAYLETGELEKAKNVLDQLISHERIVDQGGIYWLALYERGRIAAMENQPSKAIEYYLKAIEIIEKQRATLSSETGKIGFAGNKQGVYEQLVATLVHQSRADTAFEVVERSKARALVDLLAGKLREAEIFSEAGDPRQLEPLTQARLSIQDLSTLLPSDETLIEYYIANNQLIIFSYNQGQLDVNTAPSNSIVQNISRYRRAIASRNKTLQTKLSKTLYNQLILPATIRGKHLTVIPHGALHYLPFGSLTLSNGKPLINEWPYRILPASSLLKLLEHHADNGKALILGNPDLNDKAMDLPGAEIEVKQIGKLLHATPLVRKAATESAVKQLGITYARLHFASHGQFHPANPLDSALILAPDQIDDGRLTVRDVYDLKLKANLVTLSACETGLGKITTGDDIVGLTRGFMYAGASSIVSSLWQVEDQSTALLMASFYKNLKQMDKRLALTQAQKAVMKKYPDPFFWAAFQITGVVE